MAFFNHSTMGSYHGWIPWVYIVGGFHFISFHFIYLFLDHKFNKIKKSISYGKSA